MRVCFLVTGIPRRFSKHLYKYLQQLEATLAFDVYIYFPKENCDENYANEVFQPQIFSSILQNPRYKLLLLDSQIPSIPDSFTQKQKNYIIQWYRIQKCFQFIPNEYELIIRIRPDVDFTIPPSSFIDILKTCNENKIYIPEGYDEQSTINDQIAIGNFNAMKIYCSLFSSLSFDTVFSTNITLEDFLKKHEFVISRISIPYKLALSDCKVIAIAGDSASGKTTLMKAIQQIMPDDSSLCIETDSYHKWERNDEHWNSYTHLHPEANHLERMSEDMVRLKIGNSVSLIDYDHSTGKFTQGKLTEGKPFILFCGLHTLYTKNLLKHLDIKIFLDAHSNIKQEWKIKRDTKERNHSVETVLKSIEKRKVDSETYILPQKEHANFIIEYSGEQDKVVTNVCMSPLFSGIVHVHSDFFSDKSILFHNGMTKYSLSTTKTSEMIYEYLCQYQSKLFYFPQRNLFQNGTMGILQMLIFLLLFYDYE
jgi:uridine kinase